MEDVKIKLSALWVSHFLIWTFGDMVRLIQPDGLEDVIADPASNELLLFVAAPLGAIQAFMIVLSVMWERKANRRANISMGILYTLINIAHLADIIVNQLAAWEILLAVVYLTFNVLIIKHAWEWRTEES
ncbi:MAG: hypothetical protein KAR35_03945 [Candidatus Heimdallarchaeota archaeon]|nr:hypothetical protein [Candidatus Heimdallarchaeota archaeon]MCK5048507.1 hypothetical protein [Candidatus Heimdallarchaeota archaeon]